MQPTEKKLVVANVAMWCFQALYTVSPIDLIPDLIPLLGWMDDGLLFMVTAGFTVYTLYRMKQAGALPLDLFKAVSKGTGAETPIDIYEPIDPVELQRL